VQHHAGIDSQDIYSFKLGYELTDTIIHLFRPIHLLRASKAGAIRVVVLIVPHLY
jgi:hypothetical protein